MTHRAPSIIFRSRDKIREAENIILDFFIRLMDFFIRFNMESNSPQAQSSNNANQNSPQNYKHPIALEKITLVNVEGLNKHAQIVTFKKFQFQGIVKMLNDTEAIQTRKIRKIAMTGIKLSFNSKLQEMFVGLGCSLAEENRCTFNGKIYLKKARIKDVADKVNITRKFETVQNFDRNAVRYILNIIIYNI